ncbi:MAG: ester cyclase [Dehalococcoidia bacterium]|nr:ester cyclase [Dehalococcoidia bacterium]
MSTEKNKMIARRIPLEALNEGKLGVIDEIVSPDFVNWSPMPGLPDRGPEALTQLVNTIRTAFPDICYTLDAEIAEGDKVVHLATARGTNTGSLMGLPATGKPATWIETHILEFAEGKVLAHWGQVDLLGMMQQLGLAPRPEAAQNAA